MGFVWKVRQYSGMYGTARDTGIGSIRGGSWEHFALSAGLQTFIMPSEPLLDTGSEVPRGVIVDWILLMHDSLP